MQTNKTSLFYLVLQKRTLRDPWILTGVCSLRHNYSCSISSFAPAARSNVHASYIVFSKRRHKFIWLAAYLGWKKFRKWQLALKLRCCLNYNKFDIPNPKKHVHACKYTCMYYIKELAQTYLSPCWLHQAAVAASQGCCPAKQCLPVVSLNQGAKLIDLLHHQQCPWVHQRHQLSSMLMRQQLADRPTTFDLWHIPNIQQMYVHVACNSKLYMYNVYVYPKTINIGVHYICTCSSACWTWCI